MKPIFKIRRASEKDLRAISRLILIGTRSGKILKRPLAELKQSIHHFWVAEEKKRIVACCAVETYNKKLGEIRSLAVETNRQRIGIASALVSRCVKEARKKGIYEVLVITDRENLFKRLGFAEQLHGQKALFLRP